MAPPRTAHRLGAMSVRLLSGRATPGREAEFPAAPGAYVTDGTRLFRCLETHEGGEVALEDCASFECIHVYFDEVASGMRLVKPAPERDRRPFRHQQWAVLGSNQ